MLKSTKIFGFEFSFAGGIVAGVPGGGVVTTAIDAGGSLCYYSTTLQYREL
jgi:hypothetical protein